MDYSEAKKRILAAQKLLNDTGINKETFEAIRALVKGIHPRMDKIFNTCSEQLSTFEKYQKGEILELSLEAMPETTQEHKKRKKALLLFLHNWKELKGEIVRVQQELESPTFHQQRTNRIKSVGRIVVLAKGPVGMITLIAVVVVLVSAARQKQTLTVKTQYLIVNSHKVPLSQFHIGTGTDCDAAHYHAKNITSVTAVDGTVLSDPGGCGFGKVASVPQITE